MAVVEIPQDIYLLEYVLMFGVPCFIQKGMLCFLLYLCE